MTNFYDPESGMHVEVIEPGSAADPFSAGKTTVFPQTAALPSVGTGGLIPLDALKPTETTPEPIATQTPQTEAPAVQAPARTLTPLEQAIKDGNLEGYIADATKQSIQEALRVQQSGYDKRAAALENELKEAREAKIRLERESKLQNEELTDEDRELLRNRWALEDERHELDVYYDELDNYAMVQYATALATESSRFGVTVEELMQFKEPEEMDAYVANKELAAYRAGTHPSVVPTNVVTPVTAEPTAEVPAGAHAPSDIGGSAPPAPPVQLSKEFGLDSLASNLNKLPWQSVPMPN